MKLNKLLIVVAVLAILLSGFSTPASVRADWSKVDQRVLDQIDADGSAGFHVIMAVQADLSGAEKLTTKVEKTTYVYNLLTRTAAETQAPLLAQLKAEGVTFQSYYIYNMIEVNAGRSTVEWLASRPEVARIVALPNPQKEPVFKETMFGPQLPEKTNTPQGTEAVEWNITRVGAPDVWAMGFNGQGMVLADNDTGAEYTHPALVGKYRGNLGGGNYNHNYNWWDAWGGAPSPVPVDYDGHGTHTLGTMVGDDGGANQIGMAPGAQWIACAGLNLECLQFFLAPWDLNGQNPDPSKAPDAINNSWYDTSGYDYRPIVQALNAAGIAVIKSAGNWGSGCSTISPPGNVPEIIATAAFAQGDVIASFSSRGPDSTYGATILKPEVAAPGVNVRSSVPGGGYEGGWNGTSMAAPHSTGLVALIWSAAPCIQGNVPLTKQIMMETAESKIDAQCTPFVGHPNDVWGWGILDAPAAVTAAMGYCGGSGGLEGLVTDASTVLPLENVEVKAQSGGGYGKIDLTDPTGYYTMTLLNGFYDVTASLVGYESVTVQDVEVITNTVTSLDISLVPQGTLFGYVMDGDNGTPLEGALISSDDGTTASTDGTGYYEMFLDEGTYVVTATLADYASATVEVTVTSGQDTQQDFDLLAEVVFVPSPLEVTVALGTSQQVAASLVNRMAVPYDFQFVEFPAGMGILGGGPDPFGYTWMDSNEAGGPSYDWVDATGGTALGLGDDEEANASLPFPFSFYGTSATSIRIGNNGGIIFNTTSGDLGYTNDNLGTTSASNLIVPFWDDMDSETGAVYYTTVGEAPNRVFVVEWFNRPHYSNTGNGTFELLLYETTNNIKFQYLDVDFGSASYNWGVSATAGIRQAGTNYLQYSYNQAVLVNELAICFNHPGSPPCDGGDIAWLGEDPVSGTVPAGSTLDVTMLFTATEAVSITLPGVYEANLIVAGDPHLVVPVVMNVIEEEPITGLAATNDSPTLLGETTTFTATVTGGTSIVYTWDFGDGATASGAVVTHVYATAGSFAATVTATNSLGSVEAETTAVIVPPRFYTFLPLIFK